MLLTRAWGGSSVHGQTAGGGSAPAAPIPRWPRQAASKTKVPSTLTLKGGRGRLCRPY